MDLPLFLTQAMESKLLVGGKNIVDHTNEQQKILEQKRQEIAEQVTLLSCVGRRASADARPQSRPLWDESRSRGSGQELLTHDHASQRLDWEHPAHIV